MHDKNQPYTRCLEVVRKVYAGRLEKAKLHAVKNKKGTVSWPPANFHIKNNVLSIFYYSHKVTEFYLAQRRSSMKKFIAIFVMASLGFVGASGMALSAPTEPLVPERGEAQVAAAPNKPAHCNAAPGQKASS